MLNLPSRFQPGTFIWHDLATAETAAAAEFYRAVFGWTTIAEEANGGRFIRLQSDGHDVGSMYALNRREREHGVPSHWTPYLCVDCIETAARSVEKAHGVMLVRPFEVEGVARIALVADSVGSIIGLWESLPRE